LAANNLFDCDVWAIFSRAEGKAMIYLLYAVLVLFAIAALKRLQKKQIQLFPWHATIALGVYMLGRGVCTTCDPKRAYGLFGIVSAYLITTYLLARGVDVWRWLLGIAILLTVVIILDAVRILPTPEIIVTAGESFAWTRRPYAMEHPNVVAGWLLLAGGAWALPGILFAQSRSAMLGWLPAVVLSKLQPRARIGLLLGGGVLFVALLSIRPGTALWRLSAWQEAVQLYQVHPLFGWGTTTYEWLGILDTAHNAMLTIMVEGGAIGGALFLWWLIELVISLSQSAHPARWSLLAFGIQNIVDDTWLHPITALFVGVLIALSLYQGQAVTTQQSNNQTN
jgi:hypothetical protein